MMKIKIVRFKRIFLIHLNLCFYKNNTFNFLITLKTFVSNIYGFHNFTIKYIRYKMKHQKRIIEHLIENSKPLG